MIENITSRYRCKTCDFSIIVEGDTSSQNAIEAYVDHLTNNHSHIMGSPETVWTDSPYIPTTE